MAHDSMTKKDLQLIEQARKTHFTQWMLIADLILQAETEEAKSKLHVIESSKYHTEEYFNGLL